MIWFDSVNHGLIDNSSLESRISIKAPQCTSGASGFPSFEGENHEDNARSGGGALVRRRPAWTRLVLGLTCGLGRYLSTTTPIIC